jgi:precorrin-2 dehydrogenase/sirohydrochlorin ferrochelatase
MPAAVERVIGLYQVAHLEGAGLVFAATNDREVNNTIVRDARRLGIPVNRADTDETEPGDFVTPAKLEVGAVIVTVSAGSAALAAKIRDDLAGKLNHWLVAMADAMIELRPMIRASRLSPPRRAEVFRDLTGDDALAALASGGIEALRGWLVSRYPELNHG